MQPLRKILKTLSPAIVLVPVLCGIISGQSALTTIQDTLFDADGAHYNGTLTIQWSTFDTTNPGTVVRQSKTVQVVNGNLLVQLTPNNTATPPANLYTVLYQSDGDQQYTETWSVPASATPLTVPQVRTGSGVGSGSGGGGSVGGLTGTGTTESSITNLVSDLNARPIKGPGFGTNAVAVIDENGQIETAVGNLGDCVFVDGTTGPCGAGVTLPTFVSGETPGGLVNGLNATFTLANTPSNSSLLLFRNGLLAQPGIDYTLNGSTIQFLSAAIPQPQDTLAAEYRIDPGSGNSGSGTATGPSGVPGVNGCGAVGAVSKNAGYQIVPADNGYLIIQAASASFTLPVTAPPAGWCVVLLDTNAGSISVGNSGNTINGVSAGYTLGPASATFVVSDGTGYWVSSAAGAGPTGSSGVAPSGTGTVKVTNGVPALVGGSAGNCVLVDGTSASCGGSAGGSNGQIQYNNAGSFAGFTPGVNGTGITTPSTLNFLNSSTFNGLQFSFSNPAGGTVQLGASGTLNNSGLTSSSFTVSFPSWLTGTSPVALGGALTMSAATGQPSHQVIGTCGLTTVFGPCSLAAGDIPTLNQNTTGTAANVTGVVSRANGGLNSSGAGTGILRDGSTPTASELTGDATTSGSNAVTVRAVNGTTLSGLATGLLKNTTGTGVPSIAAAGADFAAPTNGVSGQALTSNGAGGFGSAVTLATSATTDTTNAANITSGTLSNNRIVALPNANLANSSITLNGQSVSLGSSANVNAGAATHGVAVNEGSGSAIGGTAAGTAHQRLQSGGASADPAYADDRDVKIVPFAAAPAGSAGGSVSYALGQWSATARAGTNNIGSGLQATPSTGATLQFLIELPGDWDPANQPYINLYYASGANTSGTVNWTVSSACSKGDGSVSDDPAFNAESAFAAQTMSVANRMWAKGGQFTAMTSGNNCVPGSSVIIKVSVSGTAASAINAYQAVLTIPTLPIATEVN